MYLTSVRCSDPGAASILECDRGFLFLLSTPGVSQAFVRGRIGSFITFRGLATSS